MSDKDTNIQATGSVMIVGGGIGGMQAALDLAQSGFYVHLVTDETSIGGRMARLDKTFPTNDCAMCLLGPRMTDCQNHPNIEITTQATLSKLEGSPGNFSASIHSKPRYINADECTSCGECEQVCPVHTTDKFNLDMGTTTAISKLFPQAVPNSYYIQKRGTPPCRHNCPIDCNCQGFVAMVAQGKFVEALEVINRTVPFPGILGRICEHHCETDCNRQDHDNPVSIALLKRAAADYGIEDRKAALERGEEVYTEQKPEREADRKESIGIVGSGPAGLVAARELYLAGFSVTVYEADDKPGGLLREGIPRYRLPEDLVEAEVSPMLQGVELMPGTRVGVDVAWDTVKSRHDAVIVTVGLQQNRRIPIPGADAPRVHYGLTFLKEAAVGGKPSVGRRVVIVGGGNVAIDAARTALRLGADEVKLICVEDETEMPAHEWEVDEAIADGVDIHTRMGPQEIKIAGGIVSGIAVKRVSAAFDSDGKFNPQYIDGSEQVWDTDTVIMCVGQAPDCEFLAGSDIELRHGFIKTDPITRQTSSPKVFAAGDVLGEGGSVVAAIATAREAVESVIRFCDGRDLAQGRDVERPQPVDAPDETEVQPGDRAEQRRMSLKERPDIGFAEANLGYTRQQAIKEAERCLDCGLCSECLQCEAVCEKDALMHDDCERTETIDVGAVIMAPGFGLYDVAQSGEFGYGRYENVVSSYEFERLLSSTGPTRGHVERPSDHKPPQKVAFIQCVGSRDRSCNAEYCSSICCLYVAKEAVVAREHDPNIEPTVFYMDIRAFGKGFDRYVDTAKENVRYVRSMISSVKEDPKTGDLIITYFIDGELHEERFDMVVLAGAVRPPDAADQLAEAAGIQLNDVGFAKTSEFSPVATTRPGVYVAGGFRGPHDIPETVMSASAAAAEAMELLAPARDTMVKTKTYPEERDITGQEPRVGVFICRCGINIAGVVDVERVVAEAEKIAGVVYAQETLYTCSQDSLKGIREAIAEHDLNRVVVASCTIRTHQPLFRETLREAGLNQFLFEMANIRDQCSWVHKDDPHAATEKALDLVAMAVAKVKHHRPLTLHPVPVVQKSLVIGGGVAGMTSALSLAHQGYDVFLVEHKDCLGGNLTNIEQTIDGGDVGEFLQSITAKVENHPLITTLLGAKIDELSGHCGKFETTVTINGEDRTLEHGTVIVATGAGEKAPDMYLYGEDDRVMTGLEFERKLHGSDFAENLDEIVFIQCVESRTTDRNYCSRTCCAETIKNALTIKKQNPDARIYVLYRDVRTYGLMEKHYREAREAGITFITYDPDSEPQVTADERYLRVAIFDPASGRDIELKPDALVLAASTVAAEGTDELATMLKVPTTDDGFLLETHIKLGPMDFPSQGIFLCGSAHGPKFIAEAAYQARGAAARAASILSKSQLFVGGTVAVVDEDKCAACLTCVRVCPYSVPTIDAEKQVAVIEAVQCQGCGTCASDCPGRAIQLGNYEDAQIAAKLSGLFGRAAGD